VAAVAQVEMPLLVMEVLVVVVAITTQILVRITPEVLEYQAKAMLADRVKTIQLDVV
jgi:hypothetical protein